MRTINFVYVALKMPTPPRNAHDINVELCAEQPQVKYSVLTIFYCFAVKYSCYHIDNAKFNVLQKRYNIEQNSAAIEEEPLLVISIFTKSYY